MKINMIHPIYRNVRPYPIALFQSFPFVCHNAVDKKAKVWKSHRGLRCETNSITLKQELGYTPNSWFNEQWVLKRLEDLEFYPVPYFYNTASWHDLWEIKKLGVGKEWFERHLIHLRYRKFDVTGRLKKIGPIFKQYSALDEADAIGLFLYEYRKHEPDVIWVMEI